MDRKCKVNSDNHDREETTTTTTTTEPAMMVHDSKDNAEGNNKNNNTDVYDDDDDSSSSCSSSYFKVCASWSKAGVGTCIVVESRIGTRLVFDIGSTPIFDKTIPSRFVFVSHGHIDHVGGIFSHARAHAVSCGGSSTATYFVPRALLPKLTQAREAMEALDAFNSNDSGPGKQRNETLLKMNIVGIDPGDEIALGKTKGGESLLVRAFRTNHGGHPAVGYVVCRKTKQALKPEYRGLSGKEIRELIINQGIHKVKTEPKIIPEIAYTGDTDKHGIMLFRGGPSPSKSSSSSTTINNQNHHDDNDNNNCDNYNDKQQQEQRAQQYLIQAFQSPLLLCELTFLNKDGKGKPIQPDLAREKGHMHIQDVVEVLTSHGWYCRDENNRNANHNDDNNNDYDNDSNKNKHIVFFHLSGRHYPVSRVVEELVSDLPKWVWKRASVAISAWMMDDQNKEKTKNKNNDDDDVVLSNMIEPNGCISLKNYYYYYNKKKKHSIMSYQQLPHETRT